VPSTTPDGAVDCFGAHHAAQPLDAVPSTLESSAAGRDSRGNTSPLGPTGPSRENRSITTVPDRSASGALTLLSPLLLLLGELELLEELELLLWRPSPSLRALLELLELGLLLEELELLVSVTV
jgi:hypothetical protein